LLRRLGDRRDNVNVVVMVKVVDFSLFIDRDRRGLEQDASPPTPLAGVA
jgi:hypothetical protein